MGIIEEMISTKGGAFITRRPNEINRIIDVLEGRLLNFNQVTCYLETDADSRIFLFEDGTFEPYTELQISRVKVSEDEVILYSNLGNIYLDTYYNPN
ncbi:MAG: hypothetical protein ACM3TR_19915 [Caulobacteraceae bacterium]